MAIFSVASTVAQNAADLTNDVTNEIDSLYAIVNVQYYRDFDSTRIYINKILDIAENHQRWSDYLEALYSLSWCADYHKRMPEFRSLIAKGNEFITRHSADLDRSDPDFTHRAAMINATGLYYFSIGDYARAIAEYSRVISLSTKPLCQDSSVIWSTCSYLAQSYHKIGNFDLSLQYFDLANRYLNPKDPDYSYQQAMYMMYQGQSFFALKQYDQAFAAYRKAATLLRRLPYRHSIRNALRSAYYVVAGYYTEMEKFDSALAYMNKSISYHVADDPYYVSSHMHLGNIYFKQKKYNTAILHYEKSLRLAGKLYEQNHYSKATALRGLGDVNGAIGKYRTAKDFYHKALAQLSSHVGDQTSASSSPKESITILKSLGKLYFEESGNGKQKVLLDSCIETLKVGTSFIDGLRKELVNLETKEFIAKESMELYALGIKAAYAAYKLTEDPQYEQNIFFFIEKSKSNILLDKALDTRARNFAGIPQEVLEKERGLLGTLAILRKRIVTGGPEKTRQDYLVAQREYLKFINDLEKQYPSYHDLKYKTRTTSINDVRDWLSPAAALIEYFVTDSVIYVIGIDKSKTLVDTVHRDTPLEESVTQLLTSLRDPASGNTGSSRDAFVAFTRNSHLIFQRILEPILTKLDAKELTIIADGKLCYIPFEVLITSPPTPGTIGYSKLPYLLRDYQVKYAYSASLELERMKPRTSYRQSLVGFAPSYDEKFQHGTNTILTTLGHNQREVQEAAELWDGEMFIDSAATEKAFKEHALSANILHLATHAVIDEIESSNSGIALLTKAPDDGFLYTYELYAMDLNANLAILSGCETGIGVDSRGEGLKSLARAFKFAGCNSIVMSLWKVSDKSTRDLMNEFHKNLNSGMEKDQALRMAKLSYLDSSPLATPFFWSAFILVGDEQPLPNRNNILYIILTFAGAFLIVAAFFARRRSRRVAGLRPPINENSF